MSDHYEQEWEMRKIESNEMNKNSNWYKYFHCQT